MRRRAPGDRSVRAEETALALIRTARHLFAERGYAGTATEEVVREAGVSRGALYHHYHSKRGLFEAVYRQIQTDIQRRALEAYRTGAGTIDISRRIRAGLVGYLDEATRPDVQRIALVEAPAVLGWERWRAIDREYSLGALLAGLALARDEGLVDRTSPLEPRAHVLAAVLSEASYLIGRAEDRGVARAQMGEIVDGVLEGILGWPRP